MARTYKIRRFQNGKNSRDEPFFNYSLTIPTTIAEKLPEDVQYECVLDDKGIHFLPVDAQREIELPSWARAKQNGKGKPDEKPKPKRSRPRPGAKKAAEPVEA
jgi:hypothetical protein